MLFEVSDPDAPHQAIQATGLSVASCLAIEPALVDFGGWIPGCAPVRRDLRIRNDCDTPVRIGGVEVQSLGGEFFGVSYPGEGEEVPAFDEIPLVTVQYAPSDASPDPAHGTVFVYPVGTSEPIGGALLGRGPMLDRGRVETFIRSAETCFPLADRPEDANGNGTISAAEGELEVRLDGLITPPVNDQGQAVWGYRSDTNAVCFEPLFVPEKGAEVQLRYRASCLSH